MLLGLLWLKIIFVCLFIFQFPCKIFILLSILRIWSTCLKRWGEGELSLLAAEGMRKHVALLRAARGLEITLQLCDIQKCLAVSGWCSPLPQSQKARRLLVQSRSFLCHPTSSLLALRCWNKTSVGSQCPWCTQPASCSHLGCLSLQQAWRRGATPSPVLSLPEYCKATSLKSPPSTAKALGKYWHLPPLTSVWEKGLALQSNCERASSFLSVILHNRSWVRRENKCISLYFPSCISFKERTWLLLHLWLQQM